MLNSFDQEYGTLVKKLLRFGVDERNERTGKTVKVHRGPYFFSVDLTDDLLPTISLRRTYPQTAAAELAWFLKGDKDVKWLDQYCKIWNDFLEPDGTVAAAYGYRWRRHFGRDQIADAISALSKNPSDRRVYVSTWDPADDGLGRPSRNVPCPVGFTLNLLGNQLHSSYHLRSSDVFVGLPYDIMNHAMLVQAIANSLTARLPMVQDMIYPGTIGVTLAHAHMYDSHWDLAEEGLEKARGYGPPQIALDLNFTAEEIAEDPDFYVGSVKRASKMADHIEFNPKPELVV